MGKNLTDYYSAEDTKSILHNFHRQYTTTTKLQQFTTDIPAFLTSKKTELFTAYSDYDLQTDFPLTITYSEGFLFLETTHENTTLQWDTNYDYITFSLTNTSEDIEWTGAKYLSSVSRTNTTDMDWPTPNFEKPAVHTTHESSSVAELITRIIPVLTSQRTVYGVTQIHIPKERIAKLIIEYYSASPKAEIELSKFISLLSSIPAKNISYTHENEISI